MDSKEITEGNKIIAEFMGYKERLGRYIRKNENELIYLTLPMKYHTSWDWLMPVVEKIRKMENGVGGCFTFNWHDYRVWFSGWSDGSGVISECCMISGTTPINAVYKAVVQFVKWHNTQQHG